MTVISLLVLIAVIAVVYYVITQVPGIAEPFKKIILGILVAIVALAVIFYVAGLFGYHSPDMHLR